jgi:ribonucleoside-diphosphate reductase beta chain
MEKLEDPKYFRYFIEPNQKNPIWKAYQQAKASFWVEEEIESELKKENVKALPIEVQELLKHQLIFFLYGDGKVNETISEHIESRITDRELMTWYNFQKMVEDIHNITYVKLVDAYITDSKEREKMFGSIENYPSINKKINWVKQNLAYNDNSVKPPLAKQVLINLIMEGLFFQGSFAVIFWANEKYPGKIPGLAKANEFISRDEGQHTYVGFLVWSILSYKLPKDEIYKILNEAVEIEIEFMSESLTKKLPGMNIELMSEYIKFVADWICTNLKIEPLYKVLNPFKFMEKQSISIRSIDFFNDVNPSQYQFGRSGTNNNDAKLIFDYEDD